MSLPFSNSDARIPSNSSLALSASTIPVAPYPAPRFADFQFRTIGQQPELLKRISAPNPDKQYNHNHDSVLLSPSVQTLAPPESDSAKRPSLRDRLSLLEAPPTRRDENVDVTMANPLEFRPALDLRSAQNVSPMATSTTRARGRYADKSSPQSLRTPFSQNCGLRKEPDLQDMIYKEKMIKKAGDASASNESRFPMITGSDETENPIPPPFVQPPTQASGVSPSSSSGETLHSLTALRTLQSRLSSSLSNFNPINTANALAAAQSAKDQCTEVLATAHRAHTLAQQASLSAQDSMVAVQECLNVAVAVQNKADLALSAVEKIRSGQKIGSGGEWEHNATVKAFKNDLHQLAEWVSHWDAYESNYLRQLEERENEERKKKIALQLEHDLNKFSTKKQSYDPIMHSESSDLKISIQPRAMTVEDEADAATRAWNQHREQSAERKRLAEDGLRKREAEAELERQRLQAQSEADACEAELEKLQAERHKAEEEASRQEKEALELQRQQQEMEFTRFLRNKKQVQDDLAKVAAEEKKKAQAAEAEKEARLIAEREQKRREIHEKELLKRHHDSEKRREIEAKREVILERMKRLAMEAQPPVSADTVANILDKAKEKQSMATLTIPPSQHPSLPPSESSPLSGPNHAELGNVESKKAYPTNSPQTMQQNKSLPGTIRLDESSNSTNPASSISSIPKSSTVMQNGAKSHNVPPDIPSSIDKLLPDISTAHMPSNHIREVDRKSGDGVCNSSPRLSSSLSPLTPLSSTPNSSLPALDPPATSSNDFEEISEINIHSIGPDTGNIYVIPPSRVPPVSLAAQRANLRPFMDASGITYGPGASERKPPSSNADQSSVTTEKSRRKPLSPFQMNGDQMYRASSASNPGTMKLKLEPIHDVPLLSMPTPRPQPIIKVAPTCAALAAKQELPDFKKTKVLSTASQETSLSSKELPASAQTIPPLESLEPAVIQFDGSASTNSSILPKPKEKGRPAAVRRNVPPLASDGQSPNLEDALNQAFQGNDSDLPASPRMGPDAAVTDGWAQPVANDPMAKRQQKQLPRSVDRSPPRSIIPPVSRLVSKRSRAVDHYSPPRRHNDYSRDRRRSGSAEYTRGLSPQSNDDDRRSDDMSSTTGRKRYRDDDSADAPPPRRPRFVSPHFRQDDYVKQPSYRPPDADRSRVTNYGRSTEPEPRKTSLANRLESKKPWNSHGGSSYRPNYSGSNPYDPKNHIRYSPFPSQSIPQGSSYYGDASTQRQSSRNDDTCPPLLSRFTDSAEQTIPFNNHHGPPTSPRSHRGPRDAPPLALEQRISKPKTVPLINRLEDAN